MSAVWSLWMESRLCAGAQKSMNRSSRRREQRFCWLPMGAAFYLKDLHVDPIRVLDVQTSIGVVQRRRAALHQVARSGFLAETGYPDREVIDNPGWTLLV